jgi:hypothetical protein
VYNYPCLKKFYIWLWICIAYTPYVLDVGPTVERKVGSGIYKLLIIHICILLRILARVNSQINGKFFSHLFSLILLSCYHKLEVMSWRLDDVSEIIYWFEQITKLFPCAHENDEQPQISGHLAKNRSSLSTERNLLELLLLFIYSILLFFFFFLRNIHSLGLRKKKASCVWFFARMSLSTF